VIVTDRSSRFLEAVARRPVLLDAAMGTRLIARGLVLDHDDPAFWNRSHPEAVFDLHARDVSAGAEAVLSNTFGANRAWLARFGRGGEVEAINRSAVALARSAAGPDRFVLGSIGPSAAQEPAAYCEQAEVLADAGVDALLFETHRASAAAIALKQVQGRVSPPLLVSLVAGSDRLAETARRLVDLGASVLGGNCQAGMAAGLRHAVRLHRAVAVPLLIKPSAGRPGRACASPESFARGVPALWDLGVRLVGGCCGTTEAHVAALRSAWYHGPAPRSNT
jgi:methionine synthase I (cobalamin-dependent)